MEAAVAVLPGREVLVARCAVQHCHMAPCEVVQVTPNNTACSTTLLLLLLPAVLFVMQVRVLCQLLRLLLL